MKIKSSQDREAGGTLVMALMTAAILTTLLASYLALTMGENKTVMRSLAWNTALPMAEAGLEEALSHINKNTTNFAADSWSQSGTNYTKTRNLTNGFYTVQVSGVPGGLVTITSTGSALVVDTNYLTRTIQLSVRLPIPFKQVGLVARTIGFGGNLAADSFDSSNPLYSTGGQYDSTKATAQATVATPGLGFSMGGSSHVRGWVAAGSGGSVSVSGSALVGDASFGGTGIQSSPTNHLLPSYNVTLRDVQAPFTNATAPSSGTVSGTTYNYVLTNGNYMAGALTAGGASTTMYVQNSSVLYVTGAITLAKIVFAPGSKLDLYVATPSITFDPVIVGATPPQFAVWGLPTCTSMTVNAGTVFTGILYAPELDFFANGHASICGAICAKSFNCSGTFDFHYDQAIGSNSATNQTAILIWAEL